MKELCGAKGIKQKNRNLLGSHGEVRGRMVRDVLRNVCVCVCVHAHMRACVCTCTNAHTKRSVSFMKDLEGRSKKFGCTDMRSHWRSLSLSDTIKYMLKRIIMAVVLKKRLFRSKGWEIREHNYTYITFKKVRSSDTQ